jgi:hypothetical protein
MRKIILIRFSLRIDHFQKGAKVFSEADRNVWLENRIQIFNKVAAPSLMQHNAHVGIFMAKQDRWAYKKLDKHDKFMPVFTNNNDMKKLSNVFLRKHFDRKATYILRMDSDDAIHKNFFDDLDAPINSYISQTWGIKWDGTQTKTLPYRNNPFITTYTNKLMTPFFGDHTSLHKKNPVVIDRDPMWVQYIHGRNVSNRFGHGELDETPKDLSDFGL